MTELSLKRQKLAQQIRRSEIQKYMITCRATFDSYQSSPNSNCLLTDQQLEGYEQQMEDQSYTEDSLLKFLNKINQSDLSMVNCAYLIVKLKRVLMHIQSESCQKNATNIAKSICMKIMAESRKNKTYLSKCFRQLFDLVSEQKLQLYQIWSSIAILRNEVYFEYSFNTFITFIKEYNNSIDDILSLILKTLLHFTLPLDKNSQLKLSICNLYEIIRIINLIFQTYSLGSQDLKMTAKLLTNIISQQKEPKVAEQLVNLPQFMPVFLQAIDQKKQKEQIFSDDAQEAILELLALAFVGSQKVTQQILNSYPKTIDVFGRKLPIQMPFKTVKIMRPVTWIHQNTALTLKTLLVITNLAAQPKISFQIISSGILTQAIQLSAYPSDKVKGEVAIFFWNLMISNQKEMAQLLCEKDVLWALRNSLEADTYLMGLQYGLKCIKKILTVSNDFPSNILAWKYSFSKIKIQLCTNGTIQLVQRLILSNEEVISKEAIDIMNILKEEQNC